MRLSKKHKKKFRFLTKSFIKYIKLILEVIKLIQDIINNR